jgi:cytoskeletal protein CcmA (bactofilin family)
VLGKKTKENEVPTTPTVGPGDPRELSIIAKEMRIVGDCATSGRLRIDGSISGNVQARGLELTRSGSVSGDLSTPDDADGGVAFVIQGRVEGTVRARQVEVRQDGVVLGGVIADEAVIQGRVEGGIVARKRLALEETAVVEGDVRAVRLALKEGGEVNGTILVGERADVDAGSPGAAKGATKSAPSAARAAPASKPASEAASSDARDGSDEPEGQAELLSAGGAESRSSQKTA